MNAVSSDSKLLQIVFKTRPLLQHFSLAALKLYRQLQQQTARLNFMFKN